MSSTNRSKSRNEHKFDYYVTPIQKISLFLNKFNQVEKNILNTRGIKILDPCSGGDSQNLMSYPKALENYKILPDTIDIRSDSLANIKGNYLEINCENKYDIIITNPAFNVAIEIIQKALHDIKKSGFVIMLLRLNFFGSKSREEFWENNMPKYCFIHSRRISFTNDSRTDSIEYMHCVWQKGWKEKYFTGYILNGK